MAVQQSLGMTAAPMARYYPVRVPTGTAAESLPHSHPYSPLVKAQRVSLMVWNYHSVAAM